MIAKFEDRDINLFGEPGLTASLTPLEVFGHEPVFEDWLYYLTWTIAAALFVVAWLLLRGASASFRAVRRQRGRSRLVRRQSGVDKTLAFGISSFYAGVAGGLYAMATTFVNPRPTPSRCR